MSRTYHHGERHIRVRGVRREQPDLRRLARVIIEIAEAEAEHEAETEHRRATGRTVKVRKGLQRGGSQTGDAA